MYGIYSPDYFEPVDGGDVVPTIDGSLTAPNLDANFDPICLSGQGPLAPGQSRCPGIDGSTGDTSDTSHLWDVIGGVAGSFFRTFTGGQGVNVTGTAGTVPKAPVQQPGVSSNVLIFAGLGVLVLLVVALRK